MFGVLSACLAMGTGALAQPQSGYDQRQAPAYDQGQRDQQRQGYDQQRQGYDQQRQGYDQRQDVRQDQRSRVAQSSYSRHRHRVCYVRHHHRVCSWRG
jgi:hypothetical protein